MLKTVLALCLLLAGSQLHAQQVRPFTPRFSIDTKGKLIFVTNNIITTKQRSGGLAPAYMQNPPSCPGATFLCKNDDEHDTNIDIDADVSTFNSSSAGFTLPDCSGIEFAGLYWGAGIAISQGNNGPAPMSGGGWNQVKLKVPGSAAYQTITADATDTVNITFHGYQSFADITNIVRLNRGGMYTVANVKCDTVNSTGQPIVNAYGGWNLVVIYRDSTQPLRNLTVFDGMAVVRNAAGFNTRDVTVTGFRCPPTGPVNAKLGIVVYDGDRGAVDGFLMKQNADGIFANQTVAGESAAGISGPGDAWNSSISDTGSLVPSRIPAHQNTYGYDAHIYKLNNTGFKYLRNNDNSATIRINTTSEGYVLGLVTSEIDTYEPEMILENSFLNLNGPVLEKGDTLLITGTVKNTGTDGALNVSATDSLPPYFKYVPGSITYNGLPLTDAAGDDEATYDPLNRVVLVNVGAGSTATTGGAVDPNGTVVYNFSYKLTVSQNCQDIGVTPVALLQRSNLSYQGLAAGIGEFTGSRPLSSNGCLNPVAPDTAFLTTGCETVLPVKILDFRGTGTAAGNLLSWKCEETYDVAYYELQGSLNGRDFSILYKKEVPPRTGVFSYNFTDSATADLPLLYYRLKVVSPEGQPVLSQIVIVRKTGVASPVFFLSPNPVAANNRVKFETDQAVQELQWYDAGGRLVKTIQNPVNGQYISLNGFAPGLYFIKGRIKKGVTSTKLLIK